MDDVDEVARRVQFLGEYEALCKRYGLVVDSCGCCGSPWVVPAKAGEITGHVLSMVNDVKKKLRDG